LTYWCPISSVFCQVFPVQSYSSTFFHLNSKKVSTCTPHLRTGHCWCASLMMDNLYKSFGILLHEQFVSYLLFIHLFTYRIIYFCQYVSQLLLWQNIWDNQLIRKKGLFLAYNFRGFYLWLLDLCQGSTSWQECMMEEAILFLVAGKQRQTDRQREDRQTETNEVRI
jgi:hypothetical protein